MKKTIFLLLLIGGLLAAGTGVFATMTSDSYTIFADVFSSGGLNSTSTTYSLQDSVAEALIYSATSTSATYGIKAGFHELYPDGFLTLSTSATSIDLGTLDSASVKTASHTLTIDTNAANGFTMTVSGTTLTSGSNTITAIGATAASSTPGTEQFGINLVANTSPSVGANPSGTSPIASAAGQYGQINSFAFFSGDTVASASADINSTVLTVSYIANRELTTALGTYTTQITYAATANF